MTLPAVNATAAPFSQPSALSSSFQAPLSLCPNGIGTAVGTHTATPAPSADLPTCSRVSAAPAGNTDRCGVQDAQEMRQQQQQQQQQQQHRRRREDRQLRLWGARGQAALRAAHVLCLGVTSATVETLKGVCLAGVGAVTLVDERRCAEAGSGAAAATASAAAPRRNASHALATNFMYAAPPPAASAQAAAEAAPSPPECASAAAAAARLPPASSRSCHAPAPASAPAPARCLAAATAEGLAALDPLLRLRCVCAADPEAFLLEVFLPFAEYCGREAAGEAAAGGTGSAAAGGGGSVGGSDTPCGEADDPLLLLLHRRRRRRWAVLWARLTSAVASHRCGEHSSSASSCEAPSLSQAVAECLAAAETDGTQGTEEEEEEEGESPLPLPTVLLLSDRCRASFFPSVWATASALRDGRCLNSGAGSGPAAQGEVGGDRERERHHHERGDRLQQGTPSHHHTREGRSKNNIQGPASRAIGERLLHACRLLGVSVASVYSKGLCGVFGIESAPLSSRAPRVVGGALGAPDAATAAAAAADLRVFFPFPALRAWYERKGYDAFMRELLRRQQRCGASRGADGGAGGLADAGGGAAAAATLARPGGGGAAHSAESGEVHNGSKNDDKIIIIIDDNDNEKPEGRSASSAGVSQQEVLSERIPFMAVLYYCFQECLEETRVAAITTTAAAGTDVPPDTAACAATTTFAAAATSSSSRSSSGGGSGSDAQGSSLATDDAALLSLLFHPDPATSGGTRGGGGGGANSAVETIYARLRDPAGLRRRLPFLPHGGFHDAHERAATLNALGFHFRQRLRWLTDAPAPVTASAPEPPRAAALTRGDGESTAAPVPRASASAAAASASAVSAAPGVGVGDGARGKRSASSAAVPLANELCRRSSVADPFAPLASRVLEEWATLRHFSRGDMGNGGGGGGGGGDSHGGGGVWVGAAAANAVAAAPGLLRRVLAWSGLLLDEQVLSFFALHGIYLFYHGRRHAGLQGSEPPAPPHAFPSLRRLPLSGHVPDFSTSTDHMNELKELYRAQHEADVAQVFTLAWGALTGIGGSGAGSSSSSSGADDDGGNRYYCCLCCSCCYCCSVGKPRENGCEKTQGREGDEHECARCNATGFLHLLRRTVHHMLHPHRSAEGNQRGADSNNNNCNNNNNYRRPRHTNEYSSGNGDDDDDGTDGGDGDAGNFTVCNSLHNAVKERLLERCRFCVANVWSLDVVQPRASSAMSSGTQRTAATTTAAATEAATLDFFPLYQQFSSRLYALSDAFYEAERSVKEEKEWKEDEIQRQQAESQKNTDISRTATAAAAASQSAAPPLCISASRERITTADARFDQDTILSKEPELHSLLLTIALVAASDMAGGADERENADTNNNGGDEETSSVLTDEQDKGGRGPSDENSGKNSSSNNFCSRDNNAPGGSTSGKHHLNDFDDDDDDVDTHSNACGEKHTHHRHTRRRVSCHCCRASPSPLVSLCEHSRTSTTQLRRLIDEKAQQLYNYICRVVLNCYDSSSSSTTTSNGSSMSTHKNGQGVEDNIAGHEESQDKTSCEGDGECAGTCQQQSYPPCHHHHQHHHCPRHRRLRRRAPHPIVLHILRHVVCYEVVRSGDALTSECVLCDRCRRCCTNHRRRRHRHHGDHHRCDTGGGGASPSSSSSSASSSASSPSGHSITASKEENSGGRSSSESLNGGINRRRKSPQRRHRRHHHHHHRHHNCGTDDHVRCCCRCGAAACRPNTSVNVYDNNVVTSAIIGSFAAQEMVKSIQRANCRPCLSPLVVFNGYYNTFYTPFSPET